MDNLEYDQIDKLELTPAKRKKAEVALRRLRFAAAIRKDIEMRQAIASVAGPSRFTAEDLTTLDESSIIAFAGDGVVLLTQPAESR